MNRITLNSRSALVRLGLLPVILAGVFCQSARASYSLPAYDGFATNAPGYTNNARLRDLPPWDAGNGAGSGSNITNQWAAGLTYSGLVTSNNSGGLIANGVPSSGRDGGFVISPGVVFSATNQLYGSYLLKIQTSPTGTNLISLFSGSTGGGNTPVLGIYLDANNKLWLSKNSATPSTNTASALSVGDTHLIVFRYSYSATAPDEIALWVDPSPLGDDSNIPTPTLTTTNGSDANSVAAFDFAHRTGTAIGASGTKYLDEVRVATNWAAVTPKDCTPPAQHAVTGGGAYCSGGSGVSVGLDGSDTGIDYYFKRNGTIIAGPVAGTGAALDFGLQTVAGTYTVAGSNVTACVGPMSGNAVVTVNTAPAISAGPSNVVVCVSATANFTVTASGAGLTYQWQVDTGSGFGDVTTGTGGTTASYTTATLSGGDNGSQYRCIVSGTCSPSATSGTATLTVSSGVSYNSSTGDKTVSTTSTATFTVSASGPSLTYQWQFSTDSGFNYNNVTTGTGGTTASYTTAPLGLSDSGTKYKCIVSAACGTPFETPPATVTVLDATYRSAASGVWTVPATWEQSYDGGANWVTGTTYPTAANTTNIAVRNGHTVAVTNALSVDDLTVAAGAEVDASGALLTINDGAATVDCDVFGTIQVANVANSGFANAGTASSLVFENGGHFIWNGPATTAIPTATWADGSLCENQLGGNTATPTGLGQSFYDFYWNRTNSGAVLLGGTLTTVRHNLRMRGSSDSANSVRFMAVTSTVDLRVGNDVILEGGFTTLSGGSQANTVLNIHVGNNFVINSGATLDSRTSGAGSSANILFTNASTAQSFSNAGTITHTGSGGGCPINWKVLSGVTVNMVGGNIAMFTANNSTRDSVTVDGTLNLLTNQLTGAGSLATTGTLGGNGTNQLTSGLNSTTYGGTLNLGSPTLVDGQYFKLFDAASYGGSFASILPSPAPLNWDTTQLAVTGELRATSGAVVDPNPTNITWSVSGSTLTLLWPPNHLGWLLQTNSGNVGESNDWFTVSGSGATNQFFITIDPAKPNVFFRMLKP